MQSHERVGGGWGSRFRDAAWIWAPVLILVVFAAPSVDYMLPSYVSHLGENYQPLRALRFFSSPTTDYHKYGPMANFLLAPGYASSLGYWWLTDQFGNPSGDFPYGLARPLEQISFLLLQGRLLFLILFVSLAVLSLRWLRDAIADHAAVALAFLFCLGTNYCVAGFVANTRPDGPMFAFLLLSVALYARILERGLDLWRGVGLSLLAVFAISSKEVAATVYVLPYLGLGWLAWGKWRDRPEERTALRHTIAATLCAGVGSYLLLNAVYAPTVWLERMTHWLDGSGADSAVWGGLGSGAMSQAEFAIFLFESFLNTLGPGGSLAILLAIAALLIRRPPMWLLLLLPFASVMLLGLIPIGYGSDYFTSVATVALIPAAARGFASLRALLSTWEPARRGIGLLLAVGLAANLVFGTFAWHRLDGFFQRVVERDVEENPPDGATIAQPDWFPHIPGKSRLAWLGYGFDHRSLGGIGEAPHEDRPGRIYMSKGGLGFLEDARHQPARAEMLREQGLDVEDWEGIESLGYRLARTIATDTPSWFVFDWMPAVEYWAAVSPVFVYEKVPLVRRRAPGDERSG